MSAPTSTAARACSMFCTWQINLAPAALIRGANGTGDPNDSITAAGECASTSSSNTGRLASDQVIKPQPTRVFRASANSRSSHSASPYPPPIRPSPPAAVTAAASLPPAANAIGAEMIGCSIPSISVNRVYKAIRVSSQATKSIYRKSPRELPCFSKEQFRLRRLIIDTVDEYLSNPIPLGDQA